MLPSIRRGWNSETRVPAWFYFCVQPHTNVFCWYSFYDCCGKCVFQNAFFFVNHSMTMCHKKALCHKKWQLLSALGSEKPWSDWDALSLFYSLELPLVLSYIYSTVWRLQMLTDRFMVTNCFNKQTQSVSWEWEPGDTCVVLQLLGLPHHLVPPFSPVKSGKGGVCQKLCLQVKTYFVHLDQYWRGRFILTVVLICSEERKVCGDFVDIQVNICIMWGWIVQVDAYFLILKVANVFLP